MFRGNAVEPYALQSRPIMSNIEDEDDDIRPKGKRWLFILYRSQIPLSIEPRHATFSCKFEQKLEKTLPPIDKRRMKWPETWPLQVR